LKVKVLRQRCVLPEHIREEDVMRVERWGNSLAVRLSAAVVDALGLKVGDEVEVRVVGSRAFEAGPNPDCEELIRRLRAFRGRLPDDFKFNREEANSR
jgi:antitoxin MazE